MSLKKRKFLFKFYYIGSKKFYGSQRQLDFPTIESFLIKALLNRNYINDVNEANFDVASRTDKWVSARGAAFSAITNRQPVLMELNSVLPYDIGLWGYTKVPLEFSSRFDAVYRYYKYILPLENKASLNLDLISQACKQLEGNHNFQNFSKRDKKNIDTIRTLNTASANLKENSLIFHFKSKSFLRQQVRRMVKKLVEIGMNQFNFDEFLELFNTSSYISYQPADPMGLILWDVIYDNSIQFTIDKMSIKRMNQYFYQREQESNLKKTLFHILQHDNVG
ncbi:MAG: hypothetical protein ACFFBH_07090 [Promethearchaeota archaeon]